MRIQMSKSYHAFLALVADLLSAPSVCGMDRFVQHGNITCLQHSLFVAYLSFRLCRRFGLDYKAAARGALLHDFFLYDWHEPGHGLWHGIRHPARALENARREFALSQVEQDIIEKHMWPLTLRHPPRYRETAVVCMVDKVCTVAEVLRLTGHPKIRAVIGQRLGGVYHEQKQEMDDFCGRWRSGGRSCRGAVRQKGSAADQSAR